MTEGSEETMATAQECQAALESLTARIAQMDAKERAANLANRTLSCRVTDLGVTFMTTLGADGAGAVREVDAGAPAAQIRFSADSDEVLAVAADPGSFARAWLTGKLKVEGNMLDLLRLRKLL
jgi:predicted lipid carrier protein YhbT